MHIRTLDGSAIRLGCYLYIALGGLAASSCVVTEGATVQVVEEREKAIRLEGRDHADRVVSIWLPRKALVQPWQPADARPGDSIHVKLAGWFKPDGYTERALSRVTRVAGISA